MSVEQEFVKAIQNASKPLTQAYDTTATVVRVDGSTAWVHIDGGVEETPVERTIDCAAGETVRVRLSGGMGYIIGNNSAPPTDDAVALVAVKQADAAAGTAQAAREAANAASQAAGEAIADAAAAATAAGNAQTAATNAQNSANAAANAASVADGKAVAAGNAAAVAQTAANNAQTSADNAGEYASRALGNLSTVQSVAETLTWITAHGTMTLTSDVALDPTHVYFVADAGGDYTVGGVTYAVVTDPKASELGTYYELSIDESLNNYVATHLALTSEGLWIIPVAGGFKVLIATGAGSTYTTAGTYIVDGGGNPVAVFGANFITLGSRDTQYAIGNGSVVFGTECTAQGEYSVAEGYQTIAWTYGSHSEGLKTRATGYNSHSQGALTHAFGYASHAGGFHTEVLYDYQTVMGKYNDNKSDTLLEIGNGTADNAKSNAFEVLSNGFIRLTNSQVAFGVSNGCVCIGFDDGT